MNVGFIGLGAMGLPMAKRVLSAGYKMYTTFHRRREPAQELGSMGAEFLQTPGEVAQAADIVITIVPADAELKNTIFGKTGIPSTDPIASFNWRRVSRGVIVTAHRCGLPLADP